MAGRLKILHQIGRKGSQNENIFDEQELVMVVGSSLTAGDPFD